MNVVGDPFLSWATDGDNIRRQIFDNLMSEILSEDSSNIYPTLSKLNLMDIKWVRMKKQMISMLSISVEGYVIH